jgi:hypothetical protein
VLKCHPTLPLRKRCHAHRFALSVPPYAVPPLSEKLEVSVLLCGRLEYIDDTLNVSRNGAFERDALVGDGMSEFDPASVEGLAFEHYVVITGLRWFAQSAST